MNRRERRAAARQPRPLGQAAFDRELRKVLDGDPSADPHVRRFWDEYSAAQGIEIALPRPNGIEVLRRR